MGQLSKLFSESPCPYLAYRAQENIFCKYFNAKNLARADISADALKGNVGIGLKTWMGGNDQKVAEFNRVRKQFEKLKGLKLVKAISEYRNERIRVTMNLYGIKTMIYHVIKRVPLGMQILECAFDPIDISNIKLIEKKGGNNNTYFSDGKHEYHFSSSKNTLYMIFSDMKLLEEFSVEVIDDPYTFLLNCMKKITIESSPNIEKKPKLCLPLYSIKKGEKVVEQKSGLNHWNASGRKRNFDEVYIPYSVRDKKRVPNFFPPQDIPFTLRLSDGLVISAKVCQQGGKAIMSNPNSVLGKWLLRDILCIKEGTVITYAMLEKFGIDSVIFTKNGENDYSIDFAPLGTYDAFYNLEKESEEADNV